MTTRERLEGIIEELGEVLDKGKFKSIPSYLASSVAAVCVETLEAMLPQINETDLLQLALSLRALTETLNDRGVGHLLEPMPGELREKKGKELADLTEEDLSLYLR